MKRFILIFALISVCFVDQVDATGYTWGGRFKKDHPRSDITEFCVSDKVGDVTGYQVLDISVWQNYHQLRAYYVDTGEFAAKNNVGVTGCITESQVQHNRFVHFYLSEGIKWVQDENVRYAWNGMFNGVDPCTDGMDESECSLAIGRNQRSFTRDTPINTDALQFSSDANVMTAAVGNVDDFIYQGLGFMGSQIGLFIGSGLGMLVGLMPYIIGLAIISGIVYFVYKFKFLMR